MLMMMMGGEGGEGDGGEVWEDVFEGGGLVERHYLLFLGGETWFRGWEDREKAGELD